MTRDEREHRDRMFRDLRVQIEADDVEHLSPDALMAIADGSRPADEHLEECASCRAEVEELRQLARSLRPSRNRFPLYAIAASIAVAVALVPLMVRQRPAPHQPPIAVAPTPPPARYERPEWNEWVAEAKTRRALAVPAIAEALRPHASQLRGNAPEDDLELQPDHAVVASVRPAFRWLPRRGASYKVILQTGAGVVESPLLNVPEWSPAGDLERGREYAWQVEVSQGGTRSLYPKPPASPAHFRLLDAAAIEDIDEAHRRHPGDALLLAAVLAHHGLRGEAREALDRMSDRALASALRDSLRAWP